MADIKVFERQAFIPEAIDVGCVKIPVSVDAEIAPTLIVGQDDDDIWRASEGV